MIVFPDCNSLIEKVIMMGFFPTSCAQLDIVDVLLGAQFERIEPPPV
jgi:hypothetical protein